MQHFSPGSLVKARGRDWIVLPESDPDVLRVRPLTSAHQAEEGLFLPLEGEQIRPASFVDPDPARCGDLPPELPTLEDIARDVGALRDFATHAKARKKELEKTMGSYEDGIAPELI